MPYLNEQPLTKNGPYQVTYFDDYLMHKKLLHDKCIFSMNEFYYNWVFTQDFCLKDCEESVPEENIIDGVDMTRSLETRFYINATTTNNNYTHMVFGVTQRMLTIGDAGILLQ